MVSSVSSFSCSDITIFLSNITDVNSKALNLKTPNSRSFLIFRDIKSATTFFYLEDI